MANLKKQKLLLASVLVPTANAAVICARAIFKQIPFICCTPQDDGMCSVRVSEKHWSWLQRQLANMEDDGSDTPKPAAVTD